MAGPYWSNADGKAFGGTPSGPFDSNADVTSRVANTGPFYSNADVPTGIAWVPVVDADFLGVGLAPDSDPGSMLNSMTSLGDGVYEIDYTGDGAARNGFQTGIVWFLGLPPGWQADGSTQLIQRMTILTNSTGNDEAIGWGFKDAGADLAGFFTQCNGRGFASNAAPDWSPALFGKASTGWTPGVVLSVANEPTVASEVMSFGIMGDASTPAGATVSKVSEIYSVYYNRAADTYGGRYVDVVQATNVVITAPIRATLGCGFRVLSAANVVIRVKLEWCSRPVIPAGSY